MSRYSVALVADLPEGSMRKVEAGDRKICLANIKGTGIRAIDDRCTHEDESLSEGFLWGKDVECPAHGSRFNFLTGEVSGLPATEPAKVYEVHVEGGEIYIEV